jgi:hypothetical protein
MQIGPITIRWTKDVEAEQDIRDKARAVSAALVEQLLHAAKLTETRKAEEAGG